VRNEKTNDIHNIERKEMMEIEKCACGCDETGRTIYRCLPCALNRIKTLETECEHWKEAIREGANMMDNLEAKLGVARGALSKIASFDRACGQCTMQCANVTSCEGGIARAALKEMEGKV